MGANNLPTLSKYPVYPNKKKIVLSTFFISLILSSLLSIIIENKKPNIFSSKEMNALYKWKILSKISFKKRKSFIKELLFVLENNQNSKKDIIEILKIGNFNKRIMGDINKVINSENETNFKLIDNIFKLTDLSKVIIISGIGVTKKDEYIEASKKLFIKKNEVIGNIIIEDIALDEDKTDYIETIIVRTKTLIKKEQTLFSNK